MKVSLEQVRQFIDFDLPPVEELVDRVNRQLGVVEEVIDWRQRYASAIIVKVAEVKAHPDADRLSVVQVDDGGLSEGVPRSSDGLIQVVCGAPNVQQGMFAVWLPPGSTVPASFDDAEPFVLAARKLRGVLSQGMLASEQELGISSEHDGIIELAASDLEQKDDALQPGDSFAVKFGITDYVLDIENKMFTHRPDLFGQLGVAREISAIYRQKPEEPFSNDGFDPRYSNPDWYHVFPELAEGNSELPLNVAIDVSNDESRRFMTVALKDVNTGKSPMWLKCKLVELGVKSVNHVVDLTNYVMLLTAQPTHAYDYDKLASQTIGLRLAVSGEELELLNGKTIQLSKDDLVIVDGQRPVGLAGIMGGKHTEVTSQTKNIVLEVAHFDMYRVRRTSMRHGMFTDAVTRFTKGQSPRQVDRVMGWLIDHIGGIQASPVFDNFSDSDKFSEQIVEVNTSFINRRLGLEISASYMSNLLRGASFAIVPENDDLTKLQVAVPFWRTDIVLPEDIVEEVGRLYDFGKLPRELPKRSIMPAAKNPKIELRQQIRQVLSRAGANEVLTYSFVHRQMLEQAGQNPEEAYQIVNSLSPELQYYRLSLTPSLLSKVHANIKAGHDKFALFELGRRHNKQNELNSDGAPHEARSLSLVYAAKQDDKPGAAYFTAKRILDYTAGAFEVRLRYEPLDESEQSALVAPFVPQRSAVVFSAESGARLGVIGEYRPALAHHFKLPSAAAGFELDLDQLLGATVTDATQSYQPLSRFPSVERDVCFEADQSISYAELEKTLSQQLAKLELRTSVQPLDIYQSAESSQKRTTFRIQLTPNEATLTGDEVNQLIDSSAAAVAKAHNATII